MSISAALGRGRLANLDAVLPVHESMITSGPAAGTRAIDLPSWEGISLRILPDRGFDLGQAWYRGVPLAWVSSVGETAPLPTLEGMEWSRRFGGGLMVTCGLRNAGMPSEGHGLHGTVSHLAASEVAIERVADAEGVRVTARATVDDPGGPQPLRLERQITTWAGSGRVEVSDVTTNLGTEPEAAPLLYHFNFGYPLWDGEARLELAAGSVRARDDDSRASLDSWAAPPPIEAGPERVLEHAAHREEAWGWARVRNPALGVALTIRWRRRELPRLHQWVHPAPGMCVLGVEPANCSTLGRAADRAEGRLPVLEPGEMRETRLTVEAGEA